MRRRLILALLLLSLAACAAPVEPDGGMGGTGAPVVAQPAA